MKLLSADKIQKYIENVLKYGNERRIDLAFGLYSERRPYKCEYAETFSVYCYQKI